MAPDFKDGADAGVRLKQEELPPLVPADLNVAIFIHSRRGREGEREERERERYAFKKHGTLPST